MSTNSFKVSSNQLVNMDAFFLSHSAQFSQGGQGKMHSFTMFLNKLNSFRFLFLRVHMVFIQTSSMECNANYICIILRELAVKARYMIFSILKEEIILQNQKALALDSHFVYSCGLNCCHFDYVVYDPQHLPGWNDTSSLVYASMLEKHSILLDFTGLP